MQLTSPAFTNYGAIPEKYSCEGEGVSPPLTFLDVPRDAKTLALIVDDPDAPGGTFVHWLMWNIPANTTDILENDVPTGAVEGENSMGELGYVPMCPPNGLHHYRFMGWALSESIPLEEGATRDELIKYIERYALERAELVGQYEKRGENYNPTRLE